MPAKKQITREMILRTALKLLKDRGCEAVNVKCLARELGCSTQPVYLSFSGMDELRAELIPLAVNTFENAMRSESADGVIRLYDMSYVRFAKSEPCLFRFLFMCMGAFAETKKSLLPIIEKSVRELMTVYLIGREEADLLHDRMWMNAHGIASMIATDFCGWNMEKAARMLADSKEAFTRKYKAFDVYE